MNFDRKIIKQIIIFICIIIFLIGSGILVYYQARIQDNYENNLIKDINEKKEKTCSYGILSCLKASIGASIPLQSVPTLNILFLYYIFF